MLSNDSLYGTTPPPVPVEVCEERIRLLKKNLEVVTFPYPQVKILEAIDFWTILKGENHDRQSDK